MIDLERIYESSGDAGSYRVTSGSGTSTVHIARWSLTTHRARIVVTPEAISVAEWCIATGTDEAMNGGFFTKPEFHPLGQVWVDGNEQPFTPFVEPWHERRGALHVDADGLPRIGPRDSFDRAVEGSLLQAAPVLVQAGRVVVADEDPEGLSSTCDEFDSDITAEPLPRAAIGISETELIGLCVDGRHDDEAGMLLPELARLFVELGAHTALNVDGGSSSALITAGTMRNVPRDDEGEILEGGYPTRTIIAVESLA